jgi:hypothetical protein
MKKLHLDLGTLSVESFALTEKGTAENVGTVKAHTGACYTTYTRAGGDCPKATVYQTECTGFCCFPTFGYPYPAC